MDEQSKDQELFNFWLVKVGETATRKLWAIANGEGTPAATRERLLQWFAEMAVGKPRTMEAAPGGAAAAGYGIIVLPAVAADEQ